MRALVLHDYHDLRVAEVADPRPETGELLLRVSHVGICGSDIHGYTGENGRRQPGQIMGHEASATVVSDPTGQLSVGTSVTFDPVIGCGGCGACDAGEQQRCPGRLVIGVAPERVAAFAELVVVPAANVCALSDGIELANGALVEPLAVAVHAVRRSGMQSGARVAVLGGGPIGQSLVLAALDAGASEVLVREPESGRRDLCERLGARVSDPASEGVVEAVVAALGALADVVFDAVGISLTLADALTASRDGGTVALVGMGAPRLELPAFDVSARERTIIGCFCYSHTDFEAAAALLERCASVVDELVSGVIPLEAAPEAFARLAAGDLPAGKLLIRFADD
jgi:threonine dehydrogenase-like Zn-dependent dehydrogenase